MQREIVTDSFGEITSSAHAPVPGVGIAGAVCYLLSLTVILGLSLFALVFYM